MKNLRNVLVLLLLTILSTLYISHTAYATENEPQADTVSTGPELVSWMESHIGLGGTVSLAADITLSDTWCFVPDRPGQPSITVDTNGFCITVTGDINFISDNRLTFYGIPHEKEMFRVAAGGLLSMEGCAIEEKTVDSAEAGAEKTVDSAEAGAEKTVDSAEAGAEKTVDSAEAGAGKTVDSAEVGAEKAAGQTRQTGGYALVQEEGAGLIVQDCTIAGQIRYAVCDL